MHSRTFRTVATSLLASFTIWCVAASTDAADLNSYLWYDQGYPPWWHATDESYPTWWHDGYGDNLGFPTFSEVITLPSLTAQQRNDIQAIYRTRFPSVNSIWEQVIVNRRLHRHAGDKLPPGYTIPANFSTLTQGQVQYVQRNSALIQEFHKARYDLWLAIKAKLRPEQLIELKQLGRDSTRERETGRQKIAPTRPHVW